MLSDSARCTACGRTVGALELFPGARCLECFSQTPEGQYLPTACRTCKGRGAIGSLPCGACDPWAAR